MTGFFRVFGFVAIVVALGAVAFWAVNRGAPAPAPPEEAVATPELAASVTLAMYFHIEEGMSYEKVVETIGRTGELYTAIGSAPDSDAPPAKTIYTWSNESGGRLTAVFENGVLISKDQVDLR